MNTTMPLAPVTFAADSSLSTDEIRVGVTERLEKYQSLCFLEHFAMFMGMAQLLEFGLKALLQRKYGLDHECTARWTLGRTAAALKARGLRADFCALLESVVDYRNFVAHELLANEALLRSLHRNTSAPFQIRELEKGTYELEQLIFLHDWCQEHDAWS